MEPTKIAHITTVDISLKILLLNQLESIRNAGYEVLGISSPGPDVAALSAAGFRHIAIPMTRKVTPIADLLSLWRLYRVMQRERFTIVHTHTPKAALLGQIAARLAGVPIIINTLHGLYFHDYMRPLVRRFYILIEKIAAFCSTVILSENNEDIRTAIREKVCDRNKLKFLGSGIDLSLFNPERFSSEDREDCRQDLGVAPDARIVGFVGRLAARRKGFLDFLAAAKAIAEQQPSVRFLIIGSADTGKPDAVEPAVAAEYGIADHCLFIGTRKMEEMPRYYNVMNVLVLPSLFEGLPRCVMEASAMGVPSVVSDVKGNREAVEQERNGVLVPFGDVQKLSAAILRILLEPDTATRMGAEGRRMASERWDEKIILERVNAEYARLLDRSDKPYGNLPTGEAAIG